MEFYLKLLGILALAGLLVRWALLKGGQESKPVKLSNR